MTAVAEAEAVGAQAETGARAPRVGQRKKVVAHAQTATVTARTARGINPPRLKPNDIFPALLHTSVGGQVRT